MTGTAWHTTGPFFPAGFIGAADGDLTIGRDGSPVEGEPVDLRGRILDGDGEPVVNVIVELWQADSQGRSATAADRFRGWGRVWTDSQGCYHFRTLKPGSALRHADGRARAPHLCLRLLGSGLMRPLETEVYFPDQAAVAEDPQLAAIDPALRGRLMLVAEPKPGSFRFDIRLRGEGETPFLEG
ncbi:MAG: protocatechuate 3,4-dioxygenase subunit alpha [Gemmatimonadales bacterium]